VVDAILIGLIGVVVGVTGMSPAFATARATGRPRPLAVSVPSDAVTVKPGATATVAVRVVNPGADAVRVTVTGRALVFGDNGRVTVSTHADPQWSGRVNFPAHPLEVPARASTLLNLSVRVPERLAPDLYFVGFVVTPDEAGSSGLRYVNQIASYLTIDVPGPRVRKLSARVAASRISFSGHTRGLLTVVNVGHAAVVYWGEQDTEATPGRGSPAQQRFDRSLLPAGRVRSFAVTARSEWPISLVTMRFRLVYPTTSDATTTEIEASRRVLVIEPVPAGILVAVIAALVGAAVWRRRSRAARRGARSHAKRGLRYAGR
jgi:hypothetical protein